MTDPMRNSRQARHLVRRMRRDCNIEWPGGETNAALQVDRRRRRFRLRTVDGRYSDHLTGPTPLAQLLRDGFILVRWPHGQIRLHRMEDSIEQILAQRPRAEECSRDSA